MAMPFDLRPGAPADIPAWAARLQGWRDGGDRIPDLPKTVGGVQTRMVPETAVTGRPPAGVRALSPKGGIVPLVVAPPAREQGERELIGKHALGGRAARAGARRLLERAMGFEPSVAPPARGQGLGDGLIARAKAARSGGLTRLGFAAHTSTPRQGVREIRRTKGENDEGLQDILLAWGSDA